MDGGVLVGPVKTVSFLFVCFCRGGLGDGEFELILLFFGGVSSPFN